MQATMSDVGGTPTSVEFINSTPGGGNLGYIDIDNNETFTGDLTIYSDVIVSGRTQGTDAGGNSLWNPFGASNGAVHINGGELLFADFWRGGSSIAKGDVTIEGLAVIGVSSAYGNSNQLTVNSISRGSDRSVLAVDGVNGNLGTKEKLLVANGAPTPINGMVAPWMTDNQGRYFLSYNTTNGFIPAAFTSTDLATAGATDIVNLASGGAAPAGGASVYALRTGGALTGGQINIGSGGLIQRAGGWRRLSFAWPADFRLGFGRRLGDGRQSLGQFLRLRRNRS